MNCGGLPLEYHERGGQGLVSNMKPALGLGKLKLIRPLFMLWNVYTWREMKRDGARLGLPGHKRLAHRKCTCTVALE